jgi:prophage regulatory protein
MAPKQNEEQVERERRQLDRLLFPDEVRAMVRLSEPTIYRLRRKGKFPAPILLGEKRVAYRQSEIEAWIESRGRASYAPAA